MRPEGAVVLWSRRPKAYRVSARRRRDRSKARGRTRYLLLGCSDVVVPPRRTTHLAASVLNHRSEVANQELFERIMRRVHRYFLSVIKDPHEAEDCLQTTLLDLEDSLRKEKYDPTLSFNTWVWVKARSTYLDWCRARSRRMQRLPQNLVDRCPADTELRRLQAEEILGRVQQQLGSETYEAFVLYYEGGLTKCEVAEVLGRDEKTIRRRIKHAHSMIEKLLKH